MKKTVAYLRVSTDAQTEKYGLDLQKQKILDYCERNGFTVDKWYIDGGFSGSKLDRPEMQKLLDDCKHDLIKIVLVYKLDRLSRDTADTLELFKTLPQYGVSIISMTEEIRTENPMDKMMLTMNAAMNQYEREVIRMRMSAGMVERVKKGYWMGGGRVPYGYSYDRNDGILHIVPEEAEKIKKLFQLYIDGYSCDKISHILGFKNEKIVTNILHRKSNMGLIEYKGNVYKGLHEPIIDEEMFYTAQKCMKKRSTNSHIANNHLLTGLCYCGVCGARMRYHKWDGNHRLLCYSQVKGKEYMQKDCNCNNIKPIAKNIEKEVEYYFKQFLINLDEKQEDIKSNADIINEALIKSRAKLKRLYNLYAENTTESLLEVILEEEKTIADLKNQFELETENTNFEKMKNIENIKKIADIWDDLSNKEKNKTLKECVEKVIITGDDISIHFNLG